MICDVCKADLKEEDGKSIVAKQVGLYGALAESKQGKRVKEVFGKIDFCICYVCYLKSLGIKDRLTLAKLQKCKEILEQNSIKPDKDGMIDLSETVK